MYTYIIKNKKYGWFVLIAIIAALLGTGFSFIISHLLNLAKEGTNEDLVEFICISIIYVLFTVFCEYLYSLTKYMILKDVRISLKNDLFRSVLRKNVADYEQHGGAYYLSEMTTKTDMISELFFKNVLGIPYLLFSFFSAVVACIYLNWIMLIIMIVLGIITVLITNKTGNRIEKTSKLASKQTSKYTQILKDYLDGYSVIKVFMAGDRFEKEHTLANEYLENAKIDNSKKMMIMSYSGELIGLISTVIVTGIAAIMALNNNISIGSILAFSQLMGKISAPLSSFVDMKAQLKSSTPIIKELQDTIVNETNTDSKIEPLCTELQFDNVTFSYNDEKRPVFEGCSFEITNNFKVLLTGESGSGKTTLIKLLMKFYDNYQGHIYIGGKDIREIAENSIFTKIGYLSQNPYIFESTIKNNICLYDDSVPEELLNDCVMKAGLTRFINSLPNGLETYISELGTNISGGEKQRICLARILLSDKDIIVLDELENGLDHETKEFIEDSILALMNKMIITISHDTSEQHKRKYDIIYTIKSGHLLFEGKS